MFDLPSTLSAWRGEMARHEAVDVEALAELESHLLDAFDALCAEGHDAEEAFDLAVCRLGSCGSLRAEFAKRDPRGLARERALWAVLGILTWTLLWHAWGLVAGKASLLLAATLPEAWRGESWFYGEGAMSEGYAIALALVDLAFLVLVLRWFESHRSTRWLFRLRAVTRYPVRVAFSVVAAVLAFAGAHLVVNMGLVHVVMPEVFGQAAVLNYVESIVRTLLWPVVLGTFLLRWRKAVRLGGDLGQGETDATAPVPSACFWMLLGVVGYGILGGLLQILQALLNASWFGLRPDPWPLASWLYDDRYRFSEMESVLLVLLPLTALWMWLRTLAPAPMIERLRAVLRLMRRPSRFWVLFLALSWLPSISLHALPPLMRLWIGSVEDYAIHSLIGSQTSLLLSFALLVGIVVTFLLLVKRGGAGPSGQVERTG